MKRLMITGLIAALVLPIHAAVMQDSTPAERGDEFESVTEDIEIMKRVLAKALDEHFAALSGTDRKSEQPDNAESPAESGSPVDRIADVLHRAYRAGNRGLWANSYYTRALNIEGYYAPGVGVIFTLNLPVGIKYADLPEAKPDPARDEWDEIEDVVRNPKSVSDLLVRANTRTKRPIVDRDDLDRSIEVLLNTIGRYGSRIERLQEKAEPIIIAARVNPVRWQVASAELKVAHNYLFAGGPATAHRLVIRISADAMRLYKGGGLDGGKLRERAEVTFYRAYSKGSRTSFQSPWHGPSGR